MTEMQDYRQGLLTIILFWSSIYILDFLIRKSRFSARYLSFLQRNGITVSAAQIRLFSTFFNRSFARIAHSSPRFFRVWFNVGVLFGVVCMCASVILLLYIICTSFSPSTINSTVDGGNSQMMILVLPGVNLPYTQVVYIFVALLVSAVVHEAGHAIAAILENVRFNGFGVFVMVVYPGAFVDLATDSLMSRTSLQQLRIYCAGVWHNFVLLMLTWSLLLALPFLLSPIYGTGDGVVVHEVDPNSPLYNPSSFPVGSIITEINRCPVIDSVSWAACISNIVVQDSIGFCIDYTKINNIASKSEVHNFSRILDPVECCSPTSPSDLCFGFLRDEIRQYRCLGARSVLANFECSHNRDCYLFYGESSTCLFPSQVSASRLMRVSHSQSTNELLYIGDPYKFSYAITVSDYTPAHPFLPHKLPDMLSTLLKYIVSFSAALALLNVVPCYTLDGQWVLTALLECWAAELSLDKTDQESIKFVILSLGSILLLVNISIAFLNVLF